MSVPSRMPREGYSVLERAVDPAAAGWLREQVDALGAMAERELLDPSASPLVVVAEAEDPRLVCRYEHIMATEPALAERLMGTVLPIVEDLCGEPMLLFKDKVNNKHPGGGAFRPHQDIVAYRCFGPDYHLTAMITIDAATERNGCLYVAQDYCGVASQRPDLVVEEIGGLPVFRHYWGASERHGDLLVEVEAAFSWRPLPTVPADLVIFDSFRPHQSHRNETQESRRAMFLTFAPARFGDWYGRYYDEKMRNPANPKFHVSTPTRGTQP